MRADEQVLLLRDVTEYIKQSMAMRQSAGSIGSSGGLDEKGVQTCGDADSNGVEERRDSDMGWEELVGKYCCL